MKSVIERSALQKSLGHVQSVVERRNTIPILSNVLMEAREGGLWLTATDMDLTIREFVAAEIKAAGAATASAHTLHDIVRKLPDGAQVEIDAVGETGQIALKCGRSRFSLASLPREDFPVLPDEALPHEFALPLETLRQLIDRTRFAISTEETRYYLNGVYLHAVEEGGRMLRMVATDGHRLARVEAPLPDGADGLPGVIVPRKSVNELRRLLDDTEGEAKIALSQTRIRFTLDQVVINSKLIDGTFPDYERVIPTGNDKMLKVDRRIFSEAVDRVSTISTEKSRAIKLAVGGDNLTLSATSPDAGSALEVISAEYGADVIEIGFNSRYLLDITQQIEGDMASFALSDSASPAIVRDVSDETALYVLMPMRV